MDRTILPFIIFCILSLTVAFLFHKKVKNYLLACVFSSIISSVLYQIIGIFVVGYLDPFFLIAFVVSLVVAFAISAIAGVPIAYRRRQAKDLGSHHKN